MDGELETVAAVWLCILDECACLLRGCGLIVKASGLSNLLSIKAIHPSEALLCKGQAVPTFLFPDRAVEAEQ